MNDTLARAVRSLTLPLHRFSAVSRLLLLVAGSLLVARQGFANVTLGSLFSDHIVLQREQPLSVWGAASPGEHVTVRLGDASAGTVATADGTWRVMLPPQPASTKPRQLVVQGQNTVTVRDVLIGDVWLCAGQSNMEFTVARGLDAEGEIARADYPLIRHFKIPHRVAGQPVRDVDGQWTVCSPSSAAEYSAVAFFFGREMLRHTGVPIGLINSSWGGTQIESWISSSGLAALPLAAAIDARWRSRLREFPRLEAVYQRHFPAWQREAAAAREAGRPFTAPEPRRPEGPGSRWEPSGIYNAMVAPLTPATLRGILWYQGEANAPRALEYRILFPAMIQQWRAAFGEPLPFYFVQLPNFNREFDKTRMTWAYLREAQALALKLPHTGMAVAIDIGELNNVHPANKQEVGRRLALIARRQLEHEDIEDSGPQFERVAREDDRLRITFTHAHGLTSHDTPLSSFVIAGPDHVFVPASARIEGETVVVGNPAVREPVAVRYAWHNFPTACLFNGDGLPAAPFRSDAWDLPDLAAKPAGPARTTGAAVTR